LRVGRPPAFAGNLEAAEAVLNDMQAAGCTPNNHSFTKLLSAQVRLLSADDLGLPPFCLQCACRLLLETSRVEHQERDLASFLYYLPAQAAAGKYDASRATVARMHKVSSAQGSYKVACAALPSQEHCSHLLCQLCARASYQIHTCTNLHVDHTDPAAALHALLHHPRSTTRLHAQKQLTPLALLKL
jgi:hypothetical protein